MIDASRGDSVDRRHARSSDPLVALSRLLDAARRVGRLEALAVADETGLLVAGAGLWQTCELLASIAPLVGQNDTVPTRIDVLARRSEVRRLSIDGIQVLLCGQGDESGRDLGLKYAADGCGRILGRSRHRS
jgi:hypothetical protein